LAKQAVPQVLLVQAPTSSAGAGAGAASACRPPNASAAVTATVHAAWIAFRMHRLREEVSDATVMCAENKASNESLQVPPIARDPERATSADFG
jgi:hypothetical protein